MNIVEIRKELKIAMMKRQEVSLILIDSPKAKDQKNRSIKTCYNPICRRSSLGPFIKH